MTKQELVQRMQQGQAWIPGKRVKIDFGGDQGVVMLDGAAQQVTEEDGAADTTIKVGWDDWQQLAAGQLDGMTAFMMGKLRVEGGFRTVVNLLHHHSVPRRRPGSSPNQTTALWRRLGPGLRRGTVRYPFSFASTP